MNTQEMIDKVRGFSRIGLRYNVDPSDVESRAIEQLFTSGEIDEDRNPDGYIFTVVRNAALQLYRSEKRRATPVAEFYENVVGGIEDRSEYDGLIDRVRDHVIGIIDSIEDERYRQAATGYYLNGLSTAQVSSLMDVPKGTVGRLLYEARNKLQDSQLSDLLAWDDFNREARQYNNRNHDEGASERLIAILRHEGFLP